MPVHICTACGTSYPDASEPPRQCLICDDERQYVQPGGQAWTTPERLGRSHVNGWRQLETSLFEIHTHPQFGIGQRALLLRTAEGNILWDCIPLLDESLITFIKEKGGLKAIAFSHPHYYSNMHDWARTFDCPVYIHKLDEQWVFGKGEHVKYWEGEELLLFNGIRLINAGGHFPGSSILHVPHLSAKGVLFTGDTLVLSLHKQHISVMYSYPNRVPLPRKEVQRIGDLVNKISFDALYSYTKDLDLAENVKEIFRRSMDRYLA